MKNKTTSVLALVTLQCQVGKGETFSENVSVEARGTPMDPRKGWTMTNFAAHHGTLSKVALCTWFLQEKNMVFTDFLKMRNGNWAACDILWKKISYGMQRLQHTCTATILAPVQSRDGEDKMTGNLFAIVTHCYYKDIISFKRSKSESAQHSTCHWFWTSWNFYMVFKGSPM